MIKEIVTEVSNNYLLELLFMFEEKYLIVFNVISYPLKSWNLIMRRIGNHGWVRKYTEILSTLRYEKVMYAIKHTNTTMSTEGASDFRVTNNNFLP